MDLVKLTMWECVLNFFLISKLAMEVFYAYGKTFKFNMYWPQFISFETHF